MPNRGYRFVSVLLAALLLTASALKCHQLSTEPILGNSLLDSRWLLMATVEFELFFGIWLLANLLARPTWAAALACFGLFTCVSVCKAISGHATCGCFGRVPVNPWYTGTLDLIAVLSLLRWRPKESSFAACRAVAVVLLWLAVAVPAAYAMGSYEAAVLSDAGQIIGDGKAIVLEPRKWIGKRLPLLAFVEDYPGHSLPSDKLLRQHLAEGEWLVVLYRHNCEKCREAIPRHRELANRSLENPTLPRMAMIELPPYAGQDSPPVISEMRCAAGRLDETHRWLVEGPIEIVCSHGEVRMIRDRRSE
jgi:hypothetical protein